MNLTEIDLDTIPDEVFLKPDHESLRPELKPVPTNNLFASKVRELKEAVKKSQSARGKRPLTVYEARKDAEPNKLIHELELKENKEAQDIAKWNNEVEKRRHDKQQRKQLRRIKEKVNERRNDIDN